jgi:hypothetical protein
LIDSSALDKSQYRSVSIVAIIPVKMTETLYVPYVVRFQRDDTLAEQIEERINCQVRASLGTDGLQVVKDKQAEIAEIQSARRRWAGVMLGAAVIFGAGAGNYQAVEPVNAIVSNWKRDRVADDLAELVRINEYLKSDSSAAKATLAPIKARHYESLALSYSSIFND